MTEELYETDRRRDFAHGFAIQTSFPFGCEQALGSLSSCATGLEVKAKFLRAANGSCQAALMKNAREKTEKTGNQ
jgi:hypothetical protein